MKQTNITRIFAAYIITLYIIALLVEIDTIWREAQLKWIFLQYPTSPWMPQLAILTFIPSIFYLSCVLLFMWLAFKPSTIQDNTILKITVYALTPLSTAWIASDLVIGNPHIDTTLALLYFFLGYPGLYLIYAWLVYKVFDPLLGDIDLSNTKQGLYRLSSILAVTVGAILVFVSIVGLIGRYMSLIAMLYPGIGLLVAGYHPVLKRKPYRFILAFPLLGQALNVRTIISLPMATPFLEVLDKGLISDGVLAWIMLIRGLLYPLPGFGGAEAGFALSVFFRYLSGLSSTMVISDFPSMMIPIVPLWLLVEWILVYKAISSRSSGGWIEG
ncbi:MAG: hypothetical protein F7C36_06690 [Desulfurococcales archaeon]|nr:hypothetical protein [Desulfurococcales archaeon]